VVYHLRAGFLGQYPKPTSKLMLTIFTGVATWEREIMPERQREGIAKAKSAGKYKSRAPTVRRQADEIKAAIAAGEKPTHVARWLGVARSSVYRMLEDYSAATTHPCNPVRGP